MRGVVARTWDWLARSTTRALGLALLVTVLLRVGTLRRPLLPDEGGFLYVAQHWPGPGHELYAGQWVDRPPMLILVFKVVAGLGGTPLAMRLVALGLALVLVVAAWWAGRIVAGPRGALAAALVAAALSSTPAFKGDHLIGDGVAATFVMLSCAATLAAMRANRLPEVSRWHALAWAAGAGFFAALAFLCKQNALLGGVFALVVLGPRPRRWWMALAFGAGAAVPLAVTLTWAIRGPGLGMLVDALWTFRLQAAHLLWSHHVQNLRHRDDLLAAVVASGLVLILVQLVLAVLLGRHSWLVRLALALGAAYLVFEIVFSLNWYDYYLLAAAPLAAIAAAMVTAVAEDVPRVPLLPRALPVLVVVLALVAAVASWQRPAPATPVSDYVRAAAHSHDTVFVAYGNANVLERTGLSTPYPYSWQLPLRVKDAHLRLLAATLSGPQAPTWIVELKKFSATGLPARRVDRLIGERYRLARRVCGRPVYLLRGLRRPTAWRAAGCSRDRPALAAIPGTRGRRAPVHRPRGADRVGRR